jgi:hypothetical protein
MDTVTLSLGGYDYHFTGEDRSNEWQVYAVYKRAWGECTCWLVNEAEVAGIIWNTVARRVFHRDASNIDTSAIQGTPIVVACDGCDFAYERYGKTQDDITRFELFYPHDCQRHRCTDGEVSVEIAEGGD